jgi:hypothetical protein
MDAYRVTATNQEDITVAEYIFSSLQEATKFHSGMLSKGYTSIINRMKV